MDSLVELQYGNMVVFCHCVAFAIIINKKDGGGGYWGFKSFSNTKILKAPVIEAPPTKIFLNCQKFCTHHNHLEF